MEKNIILVGFMGTGKTTTGKIISEKLSMDFIDLDRLIEERYNIEISKIFKMGGETLFRKYEKSILKDIKNVKNSVIATGGGTVIDQNNVDLLKKMGVIYCLRCEEEIVRKRIENSDRPLVCENFKRKVNELMKIRENIYGSFKKQIDTTSITPEEVANKIILLNS